MAFAMATAMLVWRQRPAWGSTVSSHRTANSDQSTELRCSAPHHGGVATTA
eukprot:CAMPEP_0172896868 /NCGR_PEP_ID=MMETSP1075-20121228/156343_1 /TAXON_ID=2916 /ORGANISM="Ceratium fusus, Strain PA161109" /LENGTH=50 /DNA_ID=CAMNT_0013752331 /DNA_START=9 /DNA_END=158 /DNA_ORIENTATION=+